MLERSEEGIVLADHTKLGVTTFSKLAKLEDISMVITDPGCSQEWVDNLSARTLKSLSDISDGAAIPAVGAVFRSYPCPLESVHEAKHS